MALYSSPTLLSTLIINFIKDSALPGTYQQCCAIQKWKEVVGEAISKITIIEKVNDGILFVHVTNSSWRQELLFRKRDILNKLNQKISSPKIKDIVFK